MVEKITSRINNCLRIDNGDEFSSLEFQKYCKEEWIIRDKMNVYNPQHNGVAEHMNRTPLERARNMLNNANLAKELWAEAVSTGGYLINRSPSMEINCKIMEEVWIGHPYDYSNLKIFGCEAYSHTPKN